MSLSIEGRNRLVLLRVCVRGKPERSRMQSSPYLKIPHVAEPQMNSRDEAEQTLEGSLVLFSEDGQKPTAS